MRVAAVVPARNEADTIGAVVRELKTAALVDEVIVVSDGSSDNTVQEATEAGADIIKINKKSLGKGQAMDKGIRATDANIILFADADLIGFSARHADQLVKPVRDKKAHMCIGLRDRSWIYRKIGHKLPLISGERAIRREIFTRLRPEVRSGFMVEVAMNIQCRKQKLIVQTKTLTGLTMKKKFEKVSLLRALWGYIKMDAQVVWAYISLWHNIKS